MKISDSTSPRVLVVGLGISGITAAVALRKAGWTPVVVEKAPERRSGGYFLGFFGAGRIAAERLGILDHLHNRQGDGVRTAEVDRAGNRRAGLGFADIPNGPWMMLRGDVEKAAFDALPDDVEVRYSTTPTSIEQDEQGATVGLHDTAADQSYRERFDLVIGADGLRSTVRKLAFGPPEKYLHRLNYMICAFTLPGDLPGLEQGSGAILAEPGRSFWVFPFADHPSTVLFSYRTDDVDAEFTKPAAERLREVYGPEPLGDMMEGALKVLESSDEYLFDSVEQAHLEQWHQGRVVLLGDAAWCLTLYSGMGATTGVSGAELLARMLQRHPDDLEKALTTWEQTMRPYTDQFQKDGVNNRLVFTPGNRTDYYKRKAMMVIRRRVMSSPRLSRRMARGKMIRMRNQDMTAV